MTCSKSRRPLTLEDFVLIDKIGQGSYSTVHLAESSGKEYALKIIKKSTVQNVAELNSLKNEIAIQSQLRHENILKFYGHFVTDEEVVLILDFAPNSTLHNLLLCRPGNKLTEPIASRFTRQIAEGLNFCRSRNVIHRDLKLENILLDENLIPRIGDFGFSCVSKKSKRETRRGTPDYVSPEIILGIPYDHNVDNWSLGVLVFELVVGRAPFLDSNGMTSSKSILAVDYQTPESVSREVHHLIDGLLQKNPTDRLPIFHVLKHLWIQAMRENEAAHWKMFVKQLTEPDKNSL